MANGKFKATQQISECFKCPNYIWETHIILMSKYYDGCFMSLEVEIVSKKVFRWDSE